VPIELHSCRHTFVSLMHDAGLSLERIGDYVGHGFTYMTDRYRHLLEGHEQDAAWMLDEYLTRADTSGRLEQISAMTRDDQLSELLPGFLDDRFVIAGVALQIALALARTSSRRRFRAAVRSSSWVRG
jgi:hypothetical protein